MWHVVTTDYAPRQADIRVVRDRVFIEEQAVPREDEFDDRDPLCQHVVIYDQNQPVGTGRVDLAKEGKVGRVAVLPAYRRRGIGRLVMEQLERSARQAGLDKLWFHAQVHAIPFYESLGYHVCSPEFLEANIPHRKMEKVLSAD